MPPPHTCQILKLWITKLYWWLIYKMRDKNRKSPLSAVSRFSRHVWISIENRPKNKAMTYKSLTPIKLWPGSFMHVCVLKYHGGGINTKSLAIIHKMTKFSHMTSVGYFSRLSGHRPASAAIDSRLGLKASVILSSFSRFCIPSGTWTIPWYWRLR